MMTLLAAADTRDELDRVLDADPDAAVRSVSTEVEHAMAHTRGVVVTGAAQVGRRLAAQLPRLGIAVECFADNRADLIGPELDGIPVLSPSEAVNRYRDAAFVVSVFNPRELEEQLEGLGARATLPWTKFAWAHADRLLPLFGFSLPHVTAGAADQIRRTHDLLADEASRRMLIDQVRWRLTLASQQQDPPSAFENIYAEPGICAPAPADVYVDCGAFDGDSIELFLRRTGGRAAGIVAIEADPANLDALQARINTFSPDIARRIVVHPVAVGAKRGKATFTATGTAASNLHTTATTGDSEVEVDVAPLDDLLADTPATYVKMDVEGAEPFALAGARETLAAGKAVWAVCLYHAADHLWTIPLQIAESGGAYRHSMRRYAQNCWELVHYAVPVDRATAGGRS